jgi:hypothetical protein
LNRHAPVIKLPATATEDDYLALLGLLNSSTACFWGRQTFFPKGGYAAGKWEERLEWDGTKLQTFPLPDTRPLTLAKQLDTLAQHLITLLPAAIVRQAVPTAALLAQKHAAFDQTLARMIALQEELDWQCYQLYSLLEEAPLAEPPPLQLGQRAFEIVLARKMEAGEEESTWFTRHGSTPITQIPSDWPADYRKVVQKRIDLISGSQSDSNIALIERPEYKRRWNTQPWEEQQATALRGWLLDRLESYFDLDGRMNDEKTITARGDLTQPRLTSTARIADLARADKDFMQVAELYAGRMDFDVAALVGELIEDQSVPALPVLRYKPTGLDKRIAWESTWELQCEEDRINALIEPLVKQREEAQNAGKPTSAIEAQIKTLKATLPDIAVPPKYTSADFLKSSHWKLRGKLDVPKERWVSFPHCEGEDGSLVIAWAGYDHLQMARAIAERYEVAREHEGRKLVPLLAAIGQLIPWLKQWHNELDSVYGTRMGDYFAGYLAEEAKALNMSIEQVMAWQPATKVGRVQRKRIPTGAGGFPDSERDTLLIAAGLSVIGPAGISEELHLDAMVLMTNQKRCRALAPNADRFDAAIATIDAVFWTDTAAKWKQVRHLLQQANAINVDMHSGHITRKEPVYSTLRQRYGAAFNALGDIAVKAAHQLQNATSAIRLAQEAARKREQKIA